MKPILLWIIMIITMTGYSQAFLHPENSRGNLDPDNFPVKDPTVISNPWYNYTLDIKDYSYDSIRELTEINIPDKADAYPWISANGLRLYYTSGFYNDQLVMTERENVQSYFGTPTVIPLLINYSFGYWLSKDELDLYFSILYGDYLYYAHRDAITMPFSNPIQIDLDGYNGSGVSLNSAQDELFLYYPFANIMQFSRISSNTFAYVRDLPRPEGYKLNVGQLSKDDLTIFFGAKYNDAKTMLYKMTRINTTDTFDISTFQILPGINDTSVFNLEPSMSDSLEWVAFARNSLNYWDDNDLFLAHNGTITSVFDPDDPPIFSYAYPNPGRDNFTVKISLPALEFNLFNAAGNKILTLQKPDQIFTIQTNHLPTGIYFWVLKYPDLHLISGKWIKL